MSRPAEAAHPDRFENMVIRAGSGNGSDNGMRDRSRLVGLVAVEVALVVALHALGRMDGFAIEWSNLPAWLESTAFEDAFGAVVLVVALLMAYWLLVSTLAYLAASVSGRPGALGAVSWLTLPPVRRLVSRAVALSIAASAVVGSLTSAVAGGAGSAPVIVEVEQSGSFFPPGATAVPQSGDQSGIVVPPHLEPESTPAGHEPDPDHQPSAPVVPSVDGSISHPVTARHGDHLWGLSERHLAEVLGRSDLGEHEIARYWVRVIEANRDTIRSGDPDLIYPGEILVLPAVTTVP